MAERLTSIKLSQVEVDQAGRVIIKKPELAQAIKRFLDQKDPKIGANDEVATLSGFICSNQNC
ncbi:MAG TPA: hypothetical protein VES66_10365 [Terriglobales bacterium]|nr:hypothetical protein [Terriglobales bacterium]